MKKFKFLLGIGFVVLMVTGCAVKNTGAIDFRRVLDNSDKNLSIKHHSLSDGNNTIPVGALLSVHLKTVFINEFYEAIDTDRFKRSSGKNGEIAILVNADEAGSKSVNIDFVNNNDEKVIYYSDDIEVGQFLNFYNLPIYGPTKYNGNPFLLKLTILELDIVRDSIKKAVKHVANLSSKAYPQAAPVMQLLNKMGQLLLKGDKNDVSFEYVMVLDHKKGLDNNMSHFALESGNYIFIREEDRSKKTDWNNLFFDSKTSRLYKEPTFKELYKDNTYLVIEVNKNVSTSSATINHSTYNTLLTNLSKDNIFKGEDFNKTKEQINDVFQKQVEDRNYQKAIFMIEKIKNKKSSYFVKKRNLEKVIDLIESNGTNISLSTDDSDMIIEKLVECVSIDLNKTTYEYFKKGQLRNNIDEIMKLIKD
jgi:hypothetical protein